MMIEIETLTKERLEFVKMVASLFPLEKRHCVAKDLNRFTIVAGVRLSMENKSPRFDRHDFKMSVHIKFSENLQFQKNYCVTFRIKSWLWDQRIEDWQWSPERSESFFHRNPSPESVRKMLNKYISDYGKSIITFDNKQPKEA